MLRRFAGLYFRFWHFFKKFFSEVLAKSNAALLISEGKAKEESKCEAQVRNKINFFPAQFPKE